MRLWICRLKVSTASMNVNFWATNFEFEQELSTFSHGEQQPMGISRQRTLRFTMTEPQTPISRITATAEITLVRPGWIEQYYLPGTQFSQAMLEENQLVITDLSAYGPCVMLSVFHAGMEINLPL